MNIVYELYLVTNQVNGKRYVGITSRGTPKRWREHCISPEAIGLAIRHHGREAFVIETIYEGLSQEEAEAKEQELIREYQTIGRGGYNIACGGLGGAMSPEANEKRRAKLKGRSFTPEHRAKLSAAKKGRAVPHLHTGDVRERSARSRTGRKASDETKTRRSAAKTPEHRARLAERNRARRGIPLSDETRAKMSKVHRARYAGGYRHPMLGLSHSEDTKAKMSLAHRTPEQLAQLKALNIARRGSKHSDETRARMSEAAKRRWARVREAVASAN